MKAALMVMAGVCWLLAGMNFGLVFSDWPSMWVVVDLVLAVGLFIFGFVAWDAGTNPNRQKVRF